MRTQNQQLELPTPPEADLRKVEPLLDFIATEMANNGGRLSFERFMEIALYTPALGYYTSANNIFGGEGDFITAPELTPLFSRCIARQICQAMAEIDSAISVLEFGAGAGTMAIDILKELQVLDSLPSNYYIVEISPLLQQRQREKIVEQLPHLLDRVSWVKEVPDEFVGIIVGNEILDAIPPQRIRFNPDGNHQELYVELKDNRFCWVAGEITDSRIFENYRENFIVPYETEVNLEAMDWIAGIAHKLKQGVILLIDYGYEEKEFYRPERHKGTLMCHYKHLAHENALIHVGLQDITSHVNFTQIAEAAFGNGLSVLGFTNQTYFLISCGLESLLTNIDINNTKQFLKETQPVKQLILPDEMGELFKVIAFGKNFSQPLLGFSMNNQLERL